MMNNKEIIKQVSDYYSQKVLSHGATPEGVDWNGEESQNVRFSQLLKITDKRDGISINDIGCGYGALNEILFERNKPYTYYGYDISPEMISQASQLYSDHKHIAFIESSEPTMKADYSIASGIFNVMLDNDEDIWKKYVKEVLKQINEFSLEGFAFNMLTSYSDEDKKEDKLYYASPEEVFSFCKHSFSKDVALLHDYGLYEFTILVRKNV